MERAWHKFNSQIIKFVNIYIINPKTIRINITT